MVVGNVPEATDFIVAGAGPGGYVAALAAARAGRKVTLVDAAGADGVGGVCLRVGCIPSKAMIEASDLFHRAANASAIGIDADPRFDMGQFQRWKTEVVGQLTGGVRQLLDKAGVRVLEGRLGLFDGRTVVVNRGDDEAAMFLQFKDLVLATGSSPVELGGLPFDGEYVLDSTGVLDLGALPDRVAVVGGGYIGLELGMALARLGCAISVVEMADRLLPAMTPAIAPAMARAARDLGIDLLFGHQAESFDGTALTVQDGSGVRRQVPCDKVVVAVGRRPNSADLGLDAIGVRPREDGLLPVRPDRRIGRHVAAIGDITPGPALAHKASAEAQVAVEALCGATVAFEPATIPAVVFTDPEVASAGLDLDAAIVAGHDAAQARFPLTALGRAATLGARNGFALVVSDKADGQVLGVHLVGPHASDLIAEAVVAIEMGASLEDLALCVHPHPTLSEQIAEAAHLGLGRPIHVG